jgi:hypothetical protein
MSGTTAKTPAQVAAEGTLRCEFDDTVEVCIDRCPAHLMASARSLDSSLTNEVTAPALPALAVRPTCARFKMLGNSPCAVNQARRHMLQLTAPLQ